MQKTQKTATVKINETELSELTKRFQENLKPIVEAIVEKTMIKILTEHHVVFTKNGKKIDTYDLIRNFALEAIGISENGKVNPELLKVVREEVANIIAKEGLKNVNKSVKPVTDNTNTEDEEDENCCAAYHDGYEDGYNTAIDDANELISAIGLDIFLDIDKDGNLTLEYAEEEELNDDEEIDNEDFSEDQNVEGDEISEKDELSEEYNDGFTNGGDTGYQNGYHDGIFEGVYRAITTINDFFRKNGLEHRITITRDHTALNIVYNAKFSEFRVPLQDKSRNPRCKEKYDKTDNVVDSLSELSEFYDILRKILHK